MNIKTQLNQALKDAMKSGNETRKTTVRMTLAAIKQVEIDKRIELDESAVLAILQKEVKSRREALAEAQKANREDLVLAAQTEINILNDFLPQAMSVEELRELARQALVESGASSPSDMGKLMKALMPKVAGRAPGDQVSAIVKEMLAQ